MHRMLGSLALAALIGVVACAKRDQTEGVRHDTAMAMPAVTLSVNGVELGRAVGTDKRITMPLTTFGTKDTIFASVMTSGAPPSATLTAVWSYTKDGQTTRVDSTSQIISPTGDAVTEFHIAKPSGWPAGSYRVEIFANGTSAGSRDFDVK